MLSAWVFSSCVIVWKNSPPNKATLIVELTSFATISLESSWPSTVSQCSVMEAPRGRFHVLAQFPHCLWPEVSWLFLFDVYQIYSIFSVNHLLTRYVVSIVCCYVIVAHNFYIWNSFFLTLMGYHWQIGTALWNNHHDQANYHIRRLTQWPVFWPVVRTCKIIP